MSRPTTIKGEVVKAYLTEFPKTANLTLARKIKKETGLLFDDVEQARTMIRNYVGSNGKAHRENIADKRFLRNKTVDSGENPYDLPDSDAKEYYPFVLPKVNNRIIIMGDIHSPYHDNKAITATIDWAKEKDINTVILNGDTTDCHHLSTFVTDPRKRHFVEEREITWRLLDKIQNALPNVTFFLKAGNHEDRFERYLMVKAPEIFSTEEFRYDIIMRLGERGIIYIGDKLIIKAGDLSIVHGHELRGGSRVVNTARWLFNKAKEDSVTNHFHDVSEHSEPTLSGKLIITWAVGCLCNLHPEYDPNARWSQGFARILVEPNNSYKVFNARIIEGKVQ